MVKSETSGLPPYGGSTLHPGIRSRIIGGVNGLDMHILEAGFEQTGRPCVLLLHGFPELAYSWRNVMIPLAAAGYHVVVPDQRGYGRTTGWDDAHDGDLQPFGRINLVKDVLALVFALGYRSVAAVVGHDFGSFNAAYAALLRPEVFRSVILMSAPFAGPPSLPFDTAAPNYQPSALAPNVFADLVKLKRPRRHYQEYFRSAEANGNMLNAPQGLEAFLRAYNHFKSGDYKDNEPFPLSGFTADELAKMPTYYVMEQGKGMAETVAQAMPSAAEIAACKWLPNSELAVFVDEFRRTGFQGGLNWYRTLIGKHNAELEIFSGRTIDVPASYIAGAADWGNYQSPGAFEKMQKSVCTSWRGTHLIEGAGHFVQQERPDAVSEEILRFLRS